MIKSHSRHSFTDDAMVIRLLIMNSRTRLTLINIRMNQVHQNGATKSRIGYGVFIMSKFWIRSTILVLELWWWRVLESLEGMGKPVGFRYNSANSALRPSNIVIE